MLKNRLPLFNSLSYYSLPVFKKYFSSHTSFKSTELISRFEALSDQANKDQGKILKSLFIELDDEILNLSPFDLLKLSQALNRMSVWDISRLTQIVLHMVNVSFFLENDAFIDFLKNTSLLYRNLDEHDENHHKLIISLRHLIKSRISTFTSDQSFKLLSLDVSKLLSLEITCDFISRISSLIGHEDQLTLDTANDYSLIQRHLFTVIRRSLGISHEVELLDPLEWKYPFFDGRKCHEDKPNNSIEGISGEEIEDILSLEVLFLYLSKTTPSSGLLLSELLKLRALMNLFIHQHSMGWSSMMQKALMNTETSFHQLLKEFKPSASTVNDVKTLNAASFDLAMTAWVRPDEETRFSMNLSVNLLRNTLQNLRLEHLECSSPPDLILVAEACCIVSPSEDFGRLLLAHCFKDRMAYLRNDIALFIRTICIYLSAQAHDGCLVLLHDETLDKIEEILNEDNKIHLRTEREIILKELLKEKLNWLYLSALAKFEKRQSKKIIQLPNQTVQLKKWFNKKVYSDWIKHTSLLSMVDIVCNAIQQINKNEKYEGSTTQLPWSFTSEKTHFNSECSSTYKSRNVHINTSANHAVLDQQIPQLIRLTHIAKTCSERKQIFNQTDAK